MKSGIWFPFSIRLLESVPLYCVLYIYIFVTRIRWLLFHIQWNLLFHSYSPIETNKKEIKQFYSSISIPTEWLPHTEITVRKVLKFMWLYTISGVRTKCHDSSSSYFVMTLLGLPFSTVPLRQCHCHPLYSFTLTDLPFSNRFSAIFKYDGRSLALTCFHVNIFVEFIEWLYKLNIFKWYERWNSQNWLEYKEIFRSLIRIYLPLIRNDPILKLRKCFETLKMKKKTFLAI